MVYKYSWFFFFIKLEQSCCFMLKFVQQNILLEVNSIIKTGLLHINDFQHKVYILTTPRLVTTTLQND